MNTRNKRKYNHTKKWNRFSDGFQFLGIKADKKAEKSGKITRFSIKKIVNEVRKRIFEIYGSIFFNFLVDLVRKLSKFISFI